MDNATSFIQAWDELDPRFRVCLTQAWESLARRGLPVGAAISRGDSIVSAGRNRVYDEPGGNDPLQRTPLAHAEMNAIAAVTDGTDLHECELWTTQAPCSLCQAAIEFTRIGRVNFLSTDPSSPSDSGTFVSSGRSADVWIVVANTVFLHNVAAVGGLDNPMLAAVAAREPAVVSLVLSLVADDTLRNAADAGASIQDTLARAWDRFLDTAKQRTSRATK